VYLFNPKKQGFSDFCRFGFSGILRGVSQSVSWESPVPEGFAITTISHAVEIALRMWGYWFRGVSKPYNDLTPGAFREPHGGFQGSFESTYLDEFRRIAPSLSDNLPQRDEYLEWLFLAQHHGLPTRLLDWTESPLIALYFAVEKKWRRTENCGACNLRPLHHKPVR
jgi:hypothetical protein